jgi:hypothetical protein
MRSPVPLVVVEMRAGLLALHVKAVQDMGRRLWCGMVWAGLALALTATLAASAAARPAETTAPSLAFSHRQFLTNILILNDGKQFGRVYSSIHPAQTPYIGRNAFIQCKRAAVAASGRMRLVSVRVLRTSIERTAIPGTKVIAPVTMVRFRITVRLVGEAPYSRSAVYRAASLNGRWYQVLDPFNMRAYKRGVCPSSRAL